MKVKFTELYTPIRLAGRTETTLSEERIKGIKMDYDFDTQILEVSIGKAKAYMPFTAFKWIEPADEPEMKSSGRQASRDTARA